MIALVLLLAGLSGCGGDKPAPIYCYRTLAAPDCYAQPQPGEAHRLIGYYGPPPDTSPKTTD
ncbi:MAG: hypothetical protein H3C38_05740 [Rhodospirillales bacterium]|nr:hypothetical protein [Rhodospirillales bacterium]